MTSIVGEELYKKPIAFESCFKRISRVGAILSEGESSGCVELIRSFSPELLHALCAMGNGDEIPVVDGNYPIVAHARRLIRPDTSTAI